MVVTEGAFVVAMVVMVVLVVVVAVKECVAWTCCCYSSRVMAMVVLAT